MDPSARIYSRFNLHLYNIVVLVVSNAWAWRCSTTSTLLPFFHKNLGESAHLDVGVGTGYYPAKSVHPFSKTGNVTLVDLNEATLSTATSRLRHAGYKGTIDEVQHNVFQPLPESLRGRFDSVSLFYLLHCLPGRMEDKGPKVLANLADALRPDGVLYGATILGRGPGVSHNWFGRRLMGLYNKKGIFGNADDTLDELKRALEGCFEEVEVKLVGVVALFEARRPKMKTRFMLLDVDVVGHVIVFIVDLGQSLFL
ncbi:S-adenosyl-L-methionine dependent methyltransferase [Rhodofomes roseus]|uniref:S-adenosyl-L-methionine dependent methyltransferase n=2 Tax=Rhodofomes roseus TaxID=34475 RepID=A0ABQ8KC53_9APHY|nr:S-adenosyl-L-methionine dependent methyltransferase [Rhodofomes roseus]KAH9834887.1 S-adenosyl-L-methionine dependent methyltransferase [Rhodofomes roseus]